MIGLQPRAHAPAQPDGVAEPRDYFAFLRRQDEVLVAHQLRHRRRHFRRDSARHLRKHGGCRRIRQQPIAERADRQRGDRRKSRGIMAVDDQAGNLVVLVRHHRFLQKLLQRNVSQRYSRRDHLLRALRRDAREPVPRPRRRRLRQQVAQAVEGVAMRADAVAVDHDAFHISVVPAKAGTHTPCRQCSGTTSVYLRSRLVTAATLVVMGPRLRGDNAAGYAARTVARNLLTSAFSRLFSLDNSCAEDSTCEEAEPVSPAPRLTSAIEVATWVVPIAACWTLRAISWVAAPCSSIAAAMVAAISETRPMVPEISLIATTDSRVAACMPAICREISSVAFAVCDASALTSCATTAKPRPASPARAASIVALSANRLVCSAMVVISLVTSPIRLAASDSSAMRASVRVAWSTASVAMRLESSTCRPISLMEVVISSVAEATDCTLDEVSSDAAATTPESCWVAALLRVSTIAEFSSSLEADETFSMMLPTAVSNRSARLYNSARRLAASSRVFSSRSAVSRSALAMACTLNSSIARAICPTSSPRPSPGSCTSKLPTASSRIALVIATTGCEILRPMVKDITVPDSATPSRSKVSIVCCWSSLRPARAISRSLLSLLAVIRSSVSFSISKKLRSAPLMNMSADPASPSAISMAFRSEERR